MADEKHWWVWRVSRVAESSRHIGVGLVLACVLAAGLNPDVGLADVWPLVLGAGAALLFGWMH